MQEHLEENKVKNSDGKTLKAGGVIIRRDANVTYVLLLHREELKDWVFPKGHVEKDEDPYQTAVREIKEEVGLDVEGGKKLPDIEYDNTENPNGSIIKMYLYKSDQVDLKAIDGEGEPYWMPIDEVEEKLSYDDLKIFFRAIKNQLKAES